jgi:CBS-domain-containing membrane protein
VDAPAGRGGGEAAGRRGGRAARRRRPVGVLSQSDIMVHQAGSRGGDPATVEYLMTPALFGGSPAPPACEVGESLLALHVHHLIVLDAEGVLIGVNGALDVVRHLRVRGDHSED